jgi:hypothetical protein
MTVNMLVLLFIIRDAANSLLQTSYESPHTLCNSPRIEMSDLDVSPFSVCPPSFSAMHNGHIFQECFSGVFGLGEGVNGHFLGSPQLFHEKSGPTNPEMSYNLEVSLSMFNPLPTVNSVLQYFTKSKDLWTDNEIDARFYFIKAGFADVVDNSGNRGDVAEDTSQDPGRTNSGRKLNFGIA